MSVLVLTLLWVSYVAGVCLLAAVAARLLEPVARALRWPTRWLWALALLAQLVALTAALGAPEAARPAAWFAGLWIAASLVAVAIYLRAMRTLDRERAAWRVTVAEEMPVWVSAATGPAVVGFLRSIVVAPGWAMAMAARERRLLLRHEAEHVAAWDPTLLFAGLATCALVPWSPAAWWALARLRLAIEVDCDRRVLAAEPDVEAYGELLVAVQGRVVPGAAGIAAFAERRLPLEERLEAMTARRPRGAAWRWSMRGALAGALVLAACMAPCPPGTPAPMTTAVGKPAVVISGAAMRSVKNPDGSTTLFTPHALVTKDSAGGLRIDMSDRARAAWVAESIKAAGSPQAQRDNNTQAALRAHFTDAGANALTDNTIAYVVLDASNEIIAESRETVAQMPKMLTVVPSDMYRRFPGLSRSLEVAGTGVVTGRAIGAAQGAVVLYWTLSPTTPPGLPRNDAQAHASAESERALLGRIIRTYLQRPDVDDAAPRTIVYLVIDTTGTVVGDVREPRGDRPDGGHSVNVTPETIRRLFPSLSPDVPRHGGIADAKSFGIDADATIVYEYLQPARDPQEVALRRAVARALASSGQPSRDSAVGIVAAFDADWSLLDARRVPVAKVPESLDVAVGVRERLLPVLANRESQAEGVSTGGNDALGLAPGSAIHFWKLLPEGDERAARVKARRIVVAAASEYAVHAGLQSGRTPVTVRVLLNPDWTVYRVMHGPLTTSLTGDSIVASFGDVRDATVLRNGLTPAATGLPVGSFIAWAQLAPPRVIRVEPRKP